MIPIRCQCKVDTSNTAVLVVHHVFLVGMMAVQSCYYYPVTADQATCMQQCHAESVLTLEHVLQLRGLTLQEQ